MIPEIAIFAIGKSTYLFIDGKCVSRDVENMSYSAKDEHGELCPTLKVTELEPNAEPSMNQENLSSFIKRLGILDSVEGRNHI